MPNVPISGLPLTTSVCATALVPIVQNGVTCSTYACLLGSGGGGGAVTQITAGTGVTISPACGVGNVTICSSGGGGGLTSVGLTMPSAFCVCGSPLTSNGSICVSACGTAAQLISGCGSLISAGSGISIAGGTICSTAVLPAVGSFSTCVSSPIVCGTTCAASPLVCGTTSVCTPTLVSTNACITALSTSGCAVCVGTGGLLTAYTASGGGGGVTQICNGSGITISPACGTGVVTICSTASGIMVAGGGCNSTLRCGVNNTASGLYSFAAGSCNVACGNYSFIGGGGGNTASGLFSGAVGCNLNACNACTFYVNNFCSCGISSSATCGTSPIYCGTSCVVSPLFTGATHCGTTCVSSPLVCGTTSVCTPTLVATNACVTALSTSGCAVCVGASGLLTAYTPSGGGGGVTSIVQGTGICISPACGTGAVTICATGGGSSPVVSGSGLCSILGNGCCNTSAVAYHVTVGGQCNTSGNYACYGAIVGGFRNLSQSTFGFIGGGCNNSTSDSLGIFGFTTVVGGCSNSAYGSGSFIGGGIGNCICTQCSVIVGGFRNVTGACNGSGLLNTIVSGVCNRITGNCLGGIFTGYCNCNNYTCAVFSAGDAGYAVTLGGCCNYNTSCFGFIGNGYNNCFQNTFGYNSYGTILNGFGNRICMAQNGAILNGNGNLLGNNYSSVLSGSYNEVSGCISSVVNGNCNIVCGGCVDNIFGYCNITCNSCFGTLIGCCNCVVLACNCTTEFSFIQGNCNCVINGTPFCVPPTNSVIFGSCNKVCSNSGGGTTNHVFVFGCNLTGQVQNTAYFNNVVVCGSLSKGSGSFKIPHPDPIKAEAGKFLKHSFVESPTAGDNIYRYNVTTSNCSASIDLPNYYNLLNENSHIYISPNSHFGTAYGKINEENTKVNICSNSDGDYFVLLVGTRKDKLALDNWNGTEVESNE